VKSNSSGLTTHYSGGTTSVSHLLLVTRTDGEVFAFTSAGEDVPINGVTYLSAPGLDVTSVVTSSGLAVDNLELSTINDGEVFVLGEVLSGLWNNAAFQISKYNARDTSQGVEVILTGTIGGVQIHQDKVVAELRDLKQHLQQTVGSVTSKTCRYRLGDSRCTKDLTSFTHSATVTGVTSQQVFTASGLGQASDYFGAGQVDWLTGNNAGLSVLVKSFAGGVITLNLPLYMEIQVGDTFSAVAGCRKRLAEDCFTKFDNVLNFGGEPHLPGIDALTKPPA
jgi:uncharacterized phage protein (TIGR02218 family)